MFAEIKRDLGATSGQPGCRWVAAQIGMINKGVGAGSGEFALADGPPDS